MDKIVNDILKKHRLKKTIARKALLLEIFSQKKPTTAKELLGQLSAKGVKVNKTTIYRELQMLIAKNLITEVHLSATQVFYESTLQDHHHHLVCQNCGTIEKIALCDMVDWKTEIKQSKGFHVKKHTLEFFGICHNCY